MNNALVIIARHGKTDWNAQDKIQGQSNDIPLSQEGRNQMERLGGLLGNLRFQFIVCLSPMKRAQESFFEINKILHIPNTDVFTIDNLKKMNFGNFEGKFKQDVYTEEFKKARKKDKLNIPYPDGESYNDIATRLISSPLSYYLDKAKRERKVLLIVGHESVNRMIPPVLKISDKTLLEATGDRQKNNEIIIYKSDKSVLKQDF